MISPAFPFGVGSVYVHYPQLLAYGAYMYVALRGGARSRSRVVPTRLDRGAVCVTHRCGSRPFDLRTILVRGLDPGGAGQVITAGRNGPRRLSRVPP